jgi:hypothetical protein
MGSATVTSAPGADAEKSATEQAECLHRTLS